MVRRFDIVMVTDARLPGGTSTSVVEEIRAQAGAGFRTALLQIDSERATPNRALAAGVRGCLDRGEMELLLGDEPVEADLVVIRDPAIAAGIDRSAVPPIRATRRLLVVDTAPAPASPSDAAVDPAAPASGVAGSGAGEPDVGTAREAIATEPLAAPGRNYHPGGVAEHLEAWLDGPVDWAPVAPAIRAALLAAAPELRLLEHDWVDVIDVDAWRQPRDGARHRIPVIGRHAGDRPSAWPATRDELLRVYPERDDVEVRFLGGDRRLRELFDGRVPANWVVHPSGTLLPPRFLAGIDVYVAYPDVGYPDVAYPEVSDPDVAYAPSALAGVFGRDLLEALASGAPTVLPPSFRAQLGDAAIYAEPDDALGQVWELHADPNRYRAAAERAWNVVDDRFGQATHVRRLEALAGPTGASRQTAGGTRSPSALTAGSTIEPAAGTGPRSASGSAASGERARRRVLFVSSNGAGVGHLMRLMALAKHAPVDIEPLFMTFSQGAKVVDDAGYLVEYLASRGISGANSVRWHPILRDRVNELIERYDVRAMVFDGTWPYQGLLEAAEDQPNLGLVWSRRAMWKPGVSNRVLDAETDRFDLILEPGEFAADEDRGATRRHRNGAVQIGPVCYLGLDELLEPAKARAELGLDPDRPAALVNLGAGNINDVSSLLGQVVDRLAHERELQVCVTRSIIADRAAALPDNVRTISVYPLARYLRGFDLAFAASGYNSYHELLLAGVPTAYVPNVETATDDQAARSRFAHRVGVGLDLLDPTPESIDAAVRSLMDPDIRRRMHERALVRRVDNGANAGMEAIAELVDRGPRPRPGITQGWSGTSAPAEARLPSVPPAVSTEVPVGVSPVSTEVATEVAAEVAAEVAPGAVEVSAAGALDGVPATSAVTARSGSTALVRRSGPGSAVRSSARIVRALRPRSVLVRTLRPLRPLLERILKDGPIRDVAVASFRLLPAPVRSQVLRTVHVVKPPSRTPVTATRSAALPVAPGNVLPHAGDLALARIAIVLPLSADAATLTAVIDHTAQLQAASRSFAPLFVTSEIDFRALRRYGYLFEYFPPRDRWDRVVSHDTWLEARQRRLTAILRWFAITSVVTLPEPDETGIDGLRALLSSVIAGLDEH